MSAHPPELQIATTLRRKALLLLLPVGFGVLLLIAAIAYRQGYFEQFYELTFPIESAAGVARGTPVKLKGMMIGQVKELDTTVINANGTLGIIVTVSLNQRQAKKIPSDSKVILTQDSPLGQPHFEISPGSSTRMIANGESLEFLKRRGLKDLIESAGDEAIPIFKDLRAFSKDLADPDGEFQSGISNTIEFTRQFPAISRETITTVRAAKAMVDDLRLRAVPIFDQVSAEMPQMLEKVGGTIDNVKAGSQSLLKLTDEMRGPVLEIVDDSRHASSEARQIIGSARQSWPLNAILPQPVHQSVLPDSAVSTTVLQPRSAP